MPQHASFRMELNKTQQMPQRTRTTLHAMLYFTTGQCIRWNEVPRWHESPVKETLFKPTTQQIRQ